MLRRRIFGRRAPIRRYTMRRRVTAARFPRFGGGRKFGARGGPRPRINPNPQVTGEVVRWNPRTMQNLDPFPPTLGIHLQYCEPATNYNCGTAGIGGVENVFRLNSIYDPNLTGAGHQAYYSQTLTNLYNKYKITSVTVNIWTKSSQDHTGALGWIFQPSSSTQTLTGLGFHTAREKPGFGWCVPTVYSAGGVGKSCTFDLNMADCEGITNAQYLADSRYEGLVGGSNPSLAPYLRVAAFDLNGNNTDIQYQVMVSFVFHGYVFDRLGVAQS